MKKTFRTILTVFVSVMMIFAMVSCKTIEKKVNAAEGTFAGKTVIIHDNDVHGAIDGYANMAYLKEFYEAQGATVLVVSAGDYTQGTLYTSLSKGLNAVWLMNAVGYDVAGLGNHEFDYGWEQLKKNMAQADFKVLCSDVFLNNKTVFDADAVFKIGDLKVGFFALETPETLTKVNPGLIQGIEFATVESEKNNIFAIAQKEVDKLRRRADVVICISHLGVDKESIDKKCSAYDLLDKVNGLDFTIDAHSHTVMTKGDKGQKMQSTGDSFKNIGVIIIDNASKKIEDNFLVSTKALAKSNAVEALSKAMKTAVDKEYNSVFAKSEFLLDGNRAPGNRTQETNLGDLITDAMVWSVLKGGSIGVADDHVVAITNGGGIRATIKAGDITKAAVNTVLPFGNTVAVDYITGAALLEALEASTFCTPAQVGGFPQVSGINFTIDTKQAFDKGDLYPASTYNAPKSIKRVTINSINGKPFNAKDIYAVITNNFCAAGGDTYYALKKAYDAGTGFDTAIPLDIALMDYISEELGGVVGKKYAAPQGRIIVK